MRRDVFRAVADPTRREIINLVARRSMTPNAVAESFDVSRQAISKHIKILAECGIIVIKQQGRERLCSVQAKQLDEISDWLESFRRIWEQRFDRLDLLLIKMKPQKKSKKRKRNMRKDGTVADSHLHFVKRLLRLK